MVRCSSPDLNASIKSDHDGFDHLVCWTTWSWVFWVSFVQPLSLDRIEMRVSGSLWVCCPIQLNLFCFATEIFLYDFGSALVTSFLPFIWLSWYRWIQDHNSSYAAAVVITEEYFWEVKQQHQILVVYSGQICDHRKFGSLVSATERAFVCSGSLSVLSSISG
jgi:hypothetical protein